MKKTVDAGWKYSQYTPYSAECWSHPDYGTVTLREDGWMALEPGGMESEVRNADAGKKWLKSQHGKRVN